MVCRTTLEGSRLVGGTSLGQQSNSVPKTSAVPEKVVEHGIDCSLARRLRLLRLGQELGPRAPSTGKKRPDLTRAYSHLQLLPNHLLSLRRNQICYTRSWAYSIDFIYPPERPRLVMHGERCRYADDVSPWFYHMHVEAALVTRFALSFLCTLLLRAALFVAC